MRQDVRRTQPDSAVACSLTVMGSRRDASYFAAGAGLFALVGIWARRGRRARAASARAAAPNAAALNAA